MQMTQSRGGHAREAIIKPHYYMQSSISKWHVCIPAFWFVDSWCFCITSATCNTVAEPTSAHWTVPDPIFHLKEACSPLPTFTAYLASLTNFLLISCTANKVNAAQTVDGIVFVMLVCIEVILRPKSGEHAVAVLYRLIRK